MTPEVVAALIAAVLAYTGFVLTKENKVSEFRQFWINELRKDIAKFISLLNQLSYNSKHNQNEVEDNIAIIQKLFSLKEKVVLRLNPKDDKNIAEIIEDVIAYLNIKGHRDYEATELEDYIEQLHPQLHKLLKREWEIVKRGEPWFRFSRPVFLVVIVLLSLNLLIVLSKAAI